VKGTDLTVNPDVTQAVQDLLRKERPLGFMCIAPILAAKLIPGVQVNTLHT